MGRGRNRKVEESPEPECQIEQRSNPSSIQDSSNCKLSNSPAQCAKVARYPIRSRLQSQNLVEEANEASNIVGCAKNCGRSEEHQGQASSFNLTEVAEMMDGDSSDLCDVESRESCLDYALVTVNGYIVKQEWSLLLDSIFLKHGDIGSNCAVEGVRSRSLQMELVCEIVQKLQVTDLTELTSVDLNSMLTHVGDLEKFQVEVGWLRQRLDDIYEATRLFKGYSSLKEAERRGMQALETKEEEIVALQERIRMLDEKVLLAKNELAPMKAEANEIEEKVSEAKTKVKRFYLKSLVHDLL